MTEEFRRRSPDELLTEIEREEHRAQRGQLKVFLGYASGVGKSFQMLDEGRRRRERGEDVVACALQPDYLPEVQAIVDRLEVIPTISRDGAQVIDLPTVMARSPQVALIDGLAYDNPAGSPNPHRWQDVEQLLSAGISILATVNIQYLENLQHDIERITGSRAPFIIPQAFMEKSADEITVVDAPSQESVLINADPAGRLAEKHKLSRLRELALLVAASVVDRQLESYVRSQGSDSTWGVQERILVVITGADAAQMLESGRRNADRFQGEFHVVYIERGNSPKGGRDGFAHNLEFAHALGAEVHSLGEGNPVKLILDYAAEKGITQIFVGRTTERSSLRTRLLGDLPARLIRAAEGIDVIVYPGHG